MNYLALLIVLLLVVIGNCTAEESLVDGLEIHASTELCTYHASDVVLQFLGMTPASGRSSPARFTPRTPSYVSTPRAIKSKPADSSTINKRSTYTPAVGTTKTYGTHTVVYRNNGWYDPLTGILLFDALTDDDQENARMIEDHYNETGPQSPMGLDVLWLGLIGGLFVAKRRR